MIHPGSYLTGTFPLYTGNACTINPVNSSYIYTISIPAVAGEPATVSYNIKPPQSLDELDKDDETDVEEDVKKEEKNEGDNKVTYEENKNTSAFDADDTPQELAEAAQKKFTNNVKCMLMIIALQAIICLLVVLFYPTK